jgi:uncharacterized membrane protein YphA (DoxX/SURF4 family)
MKFIFSHPLFILLLRVLLGSIFIISGLDKIADMNAFIHSIANYQLVGTEIATLVATILPWLEILCGLGLILGIYPRASAFIITFMLIIFTVLVGSAMIRGLDISCGCFSQDSSVAKIGWTKIVENLAMILIGIYLASIKDWNFVLEHIGFLNKKSNAP